jgi:signal peptidase II
MQNSSRTPGWRRSWPIAAIVAAIVVVDQVTKYIVRQRMELGESYPENWPVRFTHVNNTGSAFGLFDNQTAFLIIASIIAIGIIIALYRQAASHGILRISLGLILGGAVSNLADRIRMGHVTDFIELPKWPVFNVADSCVTAGIVTLALVMIFSGKAKGAPAKPTEA